MITCFESVCLYYFKCRFVSCTDFKNANKGCLATLVYRVVAVAEVK